MKQPYLITYCADKLHIQTAIQAGVSEIILEHPDLSVKSLDLLGCHSRYRVSPRGDGDGNLNPFKQPAIFLDPRLRVDDKEGLIDLTSYSRSLKPDIQLSVCWDWVVRDFHFKFVDAVIDELLAMRIYRIRISDIGLMFYIHKKYPKIQLVLMHDTFHVNRESIRYFAKYLEGQILSHLLSLTEIQEILQAVKTHFEILVHGNLFLHHSRTPYLSLAQEAGLMDATEALHQIHLQDQDHPKRLFKAFENSHGFFVLNDFQRSLFSYRKELLDLALSGWLIDVRGYPLDYFKTVLEHYNSASSSQKKFEYPPFIFKPGFFRANRFDLRKKRLYQDILHHEKIVGMVIESKPKKWMIVALEYPIAKDDMVQIVTPEDVIFSYQIPEVLPISTRPMEMSSSLAKIPISRTVPPKSILINPF